MEFWLQIRGGGGVCCFVVGGAKTSGGAGQKGDRISMKYSGKRVGPVPEQNGRQAGTRPQSRTKLIVIM